MEKHSVSRLSYLFAHLYLLSSYSFSSDLVSSNLPLLSASALLCFSSLHIVGSLTSKLPSIIIPSKYQYKYLNIIYHNISLYPIIPIQSSRAFVASCASQLPPRFEVASTASVRMTCVAEKFYPKLIYIIIL